MDSSNYFLYLISFSNIIFSIPFTYFGLSKYLPHEIKADWQPPGYVFGIVWPILYLLFGIINLNIINSKNLSRSLKNSLVSDAFYESVIQSIWLLVTSNYFNGRYFIQHLIGLFILGYLVKVAFQYRRPALALYDIPSFYLYVPYSLWIVFAFILNLQIVLKYLI